MSGHTNEYIDEIDSQNEIRAMYFLEGNNGEKDKYFVTIAESETIFWNVKNEFKQLAKIESRVIPAEGFN